MKIDLLQAMVNKIAEVSGISAYLYSPELNLNSKTKPFAVVRSLTDMEKIVTFEKGKEAEYYIWVYVYPIANEYQAISLPEKIKIKLFDELSIITGEEEIDMAIYGEKIFGEDIFGKREIQYDYVYSMPLDITINRLNGMDNDLEKYGSVITCIYKIYS